MINRTLLCALAVVTLGLGCGSDDEKKSIELANEAVDAIGQGEFGKAKELLKDATSANRNNHNAWYILGQVHDQNKDYKEAAEAYSAAAQARDGEAMYHYRLGKAYWNANNAKEGGGASLPQAESALERAVQLNPKLYNAQYTLGLVYERQGKPKEAAQAWDASARLNPRFGKPFIHLGELYIKWDKLAEAVSVLDQGRLNVVEPDDLTNIYYNLGLAHGKLGQWDQAIEAYTNAIAKSSGNLDALRQRGFAYAEKGDTVNAKTDLKSFVDQGGGGDAFQLQAANQRLFRMSGP